MRFVFWVMSFSSILTLQLCKEICQPLPDWGPLLPENRTGKYAKIDMENKGVEMESQDNWKSKNGAEPHDDPTVTQPLYPKVDV